MSEPAPHRLGMADVRPLLQQRADELARLLCPGGRREGRYWIAPNPRRGDDSAGSFFVWISGEAAGAFKETDADEKGDVFDLIVYSGQAADKADALRWAKDWLGLSNAGAPEIIRLREDTAKRAKQQEQDEAERRERMRRLSRAMWLEAKPLAEKTPAFQYLMIARGLPMRRLAAMKRGLSCLRAHPRLAYRWGDFEDVAQDWRARRPRSGVSYHPALLAAMSPVNGGTNAGIHRTYLSSDGLAKARVPASKRMLGQQLGCAIKIWRGESGRSDKDLVKRNKGARCEPVVITEGIEDALSSIAGAPELRCWAVGSLAGLAALPWPDVASELIIWADNDWDKPQAINAFTAAADRLAQHGPVRIVRSPVGKDANDLLRA